MKFFLRIFYMIFHNIFLCKFQNFSKFLYKFLENFAKLFIQIGTFQKYRESLQFFLKFFIYVNSIISEENLGKEMFFQKSS